MCIELLRALPDTAPQRADPAPGGSAPSSPAPCWSRGLAGEPALLIALQQVVAKTCGSPAFKPNPVGTGDNFPVDFSLDIISCWR